jgi:hypothetical protein
MHVPVVLVFCNRSVGVVSGLRQLLEFGLFHGDPHPGNIFCLRDGRIAYVDFGNVAQLSNSNKQVGGWSAMCLCLSESLVGWVSGTPYITYTACLFGGYIDVRSCCIQAVQPAVPEPLFDYLCAAAAAPCRC